MRNQTSSSFCDVLAWLGSATADGNVRGEPRVSVRAPMTLVTGNGNGDTPHHHDAETRDITPSGICIVAAWQPSPGDTCTIELPMNAATGSSAPTHPVTVRCRVCYTTPVGEGSYRTGLAFLAA